MLSGELGPDRAASPIFQRRTSESCLSFSRVTSWPSTRTEPRSGVSMPAASFKSELLPWSRVPTTDTIALSPTVNDTSSKTDTTRPRRSKPFQTPSNAKTGSDFDTVLSHVLDDFAERLGDQLVAFGACVPVHRVYTKQNGA